MDKIDPPILVTSADGRRVGYGYAMDDRLLYIKLIDGGETTMDIKAPAKLMRRPASERN